MGPCLYVYSGDLKSGLAWIPNGQKKVVTQVDHKDTIVIFLMGNATIWNPNKWPPFVKNHLKSGQICLGFERSGFQMVGTVAIAIAKARPFENHTILNLTCKKYGFQMVRFQIPTVLSCSIRETGSNQSCFFLPDWNDCVQRLPFDRRLCGEVWEGHCRNRMRKSQHENAQRHACLLSSLAGKFKSQAMSSVALY